jgi:4-hydroxy-tetrahydrodipicolinate reductase
MFRIAIFGTGRMGRALDAAAADRSDLSVTALIGPAEPDWDARAPWAASLSGLSELPDLVIDFSLPDGTLAAARWCRGHAVALLSGVTGLPATVTEALRESAAVAPVMWAPNLSLGVNLLAELAARAAAVLDPSVPVAIEDIHHSGKKDAPSGTALMLGERIAGERGGDDSRIEYRSIREGDVIGEHTVTFSLEGEAFDLVHRAGDRAIYARGALTAAAWLVRQPPGLYSARDWLAAD